MRKKGRLVTVCKEWIIVLYFVYRYTLRTAIIHIIHSRNIRNIKAHSQEQTAVCISDSVVDEYLSVMDRRVSFAPYVF